MYRRLRKTAWAAAQARAGCSCSARRRPEPTTSGTRKKVLATSRVVGRQHDEATAITPSRPPVPTRPARTDARGGRAAQIKRARGRCCKRRHSRRHHGQGRWAAAEGHRGRALTHHRVSMHSKHGRSGRHGGKDAHSSRGGRSHSGSGRALGRSEHGSWAHGRGSHRHSHHDSASRSRRDS